MSDLLLSVSPPSIDERHARVRSAVADDDDYRALVLAVCPLPAFTIPRVVPFQRRHPPVHFISNLPAFFPPELWLMMVRYLDHSDLLCLRVVKRFLSYLLVPLTHECLVFHFPHGRHYSLDRPDVIRFVGDIEIAVTAFLQRHDMCHHVTKVVFDSWPFYDNPLFFDSWLNAVGHVVYRGTCSRALVIPPTHILPSSVAHLELRHASLEEHSLHHLLGPSPSLKRLEIFALDDGGLQPITLPAAADGLQVASWLETNGLQPSGGSHPEAVLWFDQPRPTLENVTLDFTDPSDSFGSVFECQETLLMFSLTITHDPALVSHLDNYFPIMPALRSLVFNCRSDSLNETIFVLSDMCFSQAVSVELLIHPGDDPATVGGENDTSGGWHIPRRYLEELPDIPDMWFPTPFNRQTPFGGAISVKRPCDLIRCAACPDVLENLVDWLNDRYPQSLLGLTCFERFPRLPEVFPYKYIGFFRSCYCTTLVIGVGFALFPFDYHLSWPWMDTVLFCPNFIPMFGS
ncbi:hypothetical protein BDZ89DRAFT_1046166, partial [Hymenopellis radicata]